MITAYTHTTPFPFIEALDQTASQFTDLDLSSVSTPIELESVLLNAGVVLYVNANFDTQTQEFLDAELQLSDIIGADTELISCNEDGEPIIYEQSELDDLVPCEQPTEFPEPVSLTEFYQDLAELESELASISASQDAESTKMLECVGKMRSISDRITILVDREVRIRQTETNLEELLYNYRVMSGYFKKRSDRIDEILGIFNPLVTEQQRLESEIERVTPIKNADKVRFDELNSIINPEGGDANYTQDQYVDWQAAKLALDTNTKQLNKLNTNLTSTLNKLVFQQNKISAFLDTDVTTVNTTEYGDNAEYRRQQFLSNRLAGLLTDNESAYDRVKLFSNKVDVKQGDGDSFTLEISHTIVDDENLITNRPKTYMQNSSYVTIKSANANATYSGVLYDQLYNIWADDEKFFTREEKGLTNNASGADKGLKGTGAESFKGSTVGDVSKFQDFYSNFIDKWESKVQQVKDNVIEPMLGTIAPGLDMLAIREVEYMLAYGNVFQLLPAQDQQLGDIINYLKKSSSEYTAKLEELSNDYLYVKEVHKQIIKDINTEKGKYKSVPCAVNTAPDEMVETKGAGADPFGAESLLSVDPSKPDPTKWCYWVKFAAAATAVGILPIPGEGGFRYWPIGLVIPGPNGVTKIPLPIAWLPIAVIPLPVGTFVVFIGLCGLCPSPVVFYVGPNGEKKFVVSMRPGKEFGTNAEKPAIKTVENLGIGVNTKVSDMLNDVNVPEFEPVKNDSKSTLLSDAKDKILKKVQKIKDLPDVSKLNSLDPSASIQIKLEAFKQAVTEYVNKVKVPDVKYPKDANTLNPKPTPISDMVDNLKESAKMDLPDITIPKTATINLKTKLEDAASKIDTNDISLGIKSRPTEGVDQDPKDRIIYVQSIRDSLKKAVAKIKITPEQLGVVAQAGFGVSFVNPYKCNGTSEGLTIPEIPPIVVGGIVTSTQLINNIIDGVSGDDIDRMLGGKPATSVNFGKILSGVLDKLPDIEVPNPSNISIKDMLSDSMKKAAKIQLPSLPNLSIPVQIRISVPGSLLESSIKRGVGITLDAFPIDAINLQELSPIDLKQMVVSIVEDSFAPVEDALGPFLDAVSKFKSSKDQTFAEKLGLSKVSPDTDSVIVVSKDSMDKAIDVIKTLSFIPYPAVAFAPNTFKNLHPVLAHDELPPWARFTLDNFLFVIFLDEFSRQGKKTSGFFENP